ncbi:MAG: YebC/PmpR family DNA-binding transcriptional regulator [Candidatus Sungbacteria bacterium]|nr:YebC/PmpR family DNA-binding transcriptional regulator [Candidatus Sungbacteria bacterium]
MSGHSKWAQIKHKKASTDAKRGREFSKLVREITVAAKTSGTSEDSNPRLRAAIERARSVGLPKDNIERALAKASGGENDVKLEEFLYEATAPHGLFMLVEGITDNRNRTLAEIKKILLENNGKLADPGSIIWNFTKIGIIELSLADQPKGAEDVEDAIIESGAQNMERFGNIWMVETKFEEYELVRKELERRRIKIKSSGHEYKAGSAVSLTAEEKSSIEPLLDLLTEQDDVQEVYTNLQERS